MGLLDCPGCERRRQLMKEAARKMAEWMKRPIGPPPITEILKQPPTPESESIPAESEKVNSG